MLPWLSVSVQLLRWSTELYPKVAAMSTRAMIALSSSQEKWTNSLFEMLRGFLRWISKDRQRCIQSRSELRCCRSHRRATAQPTRRQFRQRQGQAVDTDCCQRVGRSVGTRSASCCRHTITVLWSTFVGTDRRLCLGALWTRKILRELCASRSGRGW